MTANEWAWRAAVDQYCGTTLRAARWSEAIRHRWTIAEEDGATWSDRREK